MENKYYIYVFLDKSKPGKFIYDEISFDYEPFYIGKGCEDRIITSRYDKESPFKVRKIKKIERNGGEILSIKIFENLENLKSLEIEKMIISKIGRRDLGLGPLTNQTDGGDGRLNSPHSDDTKKKISETKKSQNLKGYSLPKHQIEFLRSINKGDKNPFYGKKHTEEVKEEHSKRVSGSNHPMFGKTHSPDTIKKIRENRSKSVDQEKSNQISIEYNSKKVLQFGLSGEFIQEFDSIKSASKSTGLSESLIGKTCRGVVKSPRKFIFTFKLEKDKILRNSFKIKIGDKFMISDKEYTLIKRNKKSAISSNGEKIISLRYIEFPFLSEKIEII
jgi:group I intron endonuclease